MPGGRAGRRPHELPLRVKKGPAAFAPHGVPVRSPFVPFSYGASLYETSELADVSPSSSRLNSAVKTTGTLHDVRLRSWLERRRKAVTRSASPCKKDRPDHHISLPEGDCCEANALHLPFKWVPIQARELAEEVTYFRGVHVNSLSPLLKPGLDIDWKPLEVKSKVCRPLGGIQCCVLGDKMVFCRGLLQCFDGQPAGIIQLPANMCPSGTLTFAVLYSECLEGSREASRLGLGRMKVSREGWLCNESIPAGCIVDLSGIRFAMGGGLPLTESVQVFNCSLGSQHMVMLQGRISEKFFETWPGDPLVQLPPDFRPPERCPFVVPGGRTGGFHLLHITPASCGGHLEWSDSVWNRDEIEVTGVTYETDSKFDCLPSARISWSAARRKIVLGDFHRFLTSKFGTLESAWQAYNVYGDGQVDFNDFVEGCKLARYAGNVIRLWSMLDVQNQGVITFEQFM